MTKQIETIDITPKWEGLILPMLQAFEDTNNMEVRKDIIDQLTKLAKTDYLIYNSAKSHMDRWRMHFLLYAYYLVLHTEDKLFLYL